MNNPIDHPLVREHLDAVARLTATLPAERRRELLADLREHVEVALAEASEGDEAAARQVLERLGTPRQIADAALAEEGQARPVAEGGRRTTVTLLTAGLVLPLLLVPGVGPGLALIAAIVAAVRVARAPQWSAREKRLAALLLLSPLVVVPLAVLAIALTTAMGLTPAAVLAACVVGFAPTVVAVALLARSAARVRAAAA
ncbi:HAAS signaling domain-containing protein [Kitasatospora sp. NPDC004289]